MIGRRGWAAQAVIVTLLCLVTRSVLAQAPAPAAAPAPPAGGASGATVATDENGYKVLIPIEKLAKSKSEEGKVKAVVLDILRGKTPLSDNRVYFDSYYVRYAFPVLTQTTEIALKNLPEERNRFFRIDMVESAKNPEAHAHLVGLTFDQMSAIVQDSFHPAVRYNAMLIISSLNDQEVLRTGSTPRLPEPMARALPFILAEFQKPENSDAIKVAALIGLARHLEWDPHRPQGSTPIPPALRTQIINELLALAQAKDPPSVRNAEGHLWFRRRAVEALGLACYAKLEAPVADAMDKLLKDETEPLALRFTVAAAVGRMNYQAPAKLDTLSTSKELGYLALLACNSELNRVKTLKETEEQRSARIRGESRGGSGGTGDMGPAGGEGGFEGAGAGMPAPAGAGAGMGGAGAGMGGAGAGMGGAGFGGARAGTSLAQDSKGYRFDLVRRRIREQLYCVQFGLTGGEDFDPSKKPLVTAPILPEAKLPSRGMNAFAKPGEEKKYVSDVYDKVRKLVEIVESKAVDMASLDKELRKNMKALEDLTKKVAAPVAPPTDAPAPPAATPAAAPAGAAAAAAAP